MAPARVALSRVALSRVALVVVLGLAGCGTDPTAQDPAPTPSSPTSEALFPDVVAVEVEPEGGGTWRFSVTLSSPYDSAQRYADAWRVVGPDGTVYGVRELAHDHANEQPFTRSLGGVEIPDGVDTVTVEGRDQVSGWGGATLTIALDR